MEARKCEVVARVWQYASSKGIKQWTAIFDIQLDHSKSWKSKSRILKRNSQMISLFNQLEWFTYFTYIKYLF